MAIAGYLEPCSGEILAHSLGGFVKSLVRFIILLDQPMSKPVRVLAGMAVRVIELIRDDSVVFFIGN